MLSKVEHIERLRDLRAGQRLRYSLVLVLAVAGAFVGSIALAVLIASIVFTLIDGTAPTLEDVAAVGVPLVLAFLAAIGFSSNPFVLGQNIPQTARRAARFGAINGFITGFIFGVLWSFVQGLAAVWFERWDLLLRSEVLIFGLVLGVANAPALAIYRAVTSVIEAVALNFVRREPHA